MISREAAEQAAKRRQLYRDLSPSSSARYRAYMPERFSDDGRLLSPWTEKDEREFNRRVDADDAALAAYGEQTVLQPPPASPDLAAGRGKMTVERCREYVVDVIREGAKFHNRDVNETAMYDYLAMIDRKAAELMALAGVDSDDGEPVTDEWLRDNGFKRCRNSKCTGYFAVSELNERFAHGYCRGCRPVGC